MPRREQLEELLKDDPDDVFLQYGVAMAYASEGRSAEAVDKLRAITEHHPDYVAAYFQAGQLLASAGQTESAREIVERGIAVAQRVGDSHAAMEMTGFLETL